MELSSREAEIPIPINSSATYGGGEHGNGHGQEEHENMAHHHHHLQHHQDPSNGSSNITQQPALEEEDHHHDEDHNNGPYMMMMKKKKKKKEVIIRYRECLKNHAASMGGNALDGCGEFMPSGEEGSIEALTCSACHCHRNFHRKEVQGGSGGSDPPPPFYNKFGRKFLFGDHHHHHHHKSTVLATAPEQALVGYPTGNILPSRTVPPHHHMILPYNVGPGPLIPSESDEQAEDVGGGLMVMSSRPASSSQIVMKKRFRTKFTQEQKEKMLDFAERVGWKIQKQEDSVVQQFCQEIGIRRRVLKVWMHNNKHNLAKKVNDRPPSPLPPTTTSTTTTALVS